MDTGAGGTALQINPGAVTIFTALANPSLMGMSGANDMTTGTNAEPIVVGSEQLTPPSVCGSESEKSSVK
jgi:hypothetical protein